MRRSLSVPVIATLLVVAAAVPAVVVGAPASAVPPDRAAYTYTWTDLYAECDGFTVVADVLLTVDETVFYNQDGSWTKVDLNGKVTAPVHRNDGVGPELLEKDSFRNVFTPDNPDGYGIGLGWNLTVPGYGRVYKLTGVYTWDPITGIDYEATGLNATPLDGTAPEAQMALCDYFGDI